MRGRSTAPGAAFLVLPLPVNFTDAGLVLLPCPGQAQERPVHPGLDETFPSPGRGGTVAQWKCALK
jgi:hypothetical protein